MTCTTLYPPHIFSEHDDDDDDDDDDEGNYNGKLRIY